MNKIPTQKGDTVQQFGKRKTFLRMGNAGRKT